MNNDLRLILLIIGCCLVLGIYLWEIFRKKQRRNKADILNAVDEIPDIPIKPSSDFSDEDYNKAIADLTELSAHLQNNTTNNEPTINLDEKRIETLSDECGTKRDFIETSVISDSGDGSNTENKLQENILALYITAPNNNQFNGAEIEKILTGIGMIYGDMNVFHYYENSTIGDYKEEVEPENKNSSKPFFSVANMYEPGTFTEEMSKMTTKGIVAFMYEIDSINSYKIFESIFFLNIQRIAEYLEGEIRTTDQKLLDGIFLQAIREKLRSYAMKDFLKNESK